MLASNNPTPEGTAPVTKRVKTESTDSEEAASSGGSQVVSSSLRAKVRVIFEETLSDKNVGIAVEAALFKVYFEDEGALHDRQAGKQAYKGRCRELVSNLKSNEDLKARLVEGTLLAEEFVSLSSQDMASADLKKERYEGLAESLKEATMDQSMGRTLTDEYQCPSCKEHEVEFALIAARVTHAKCDTWGQKDDDQGSLARMNCVKCGHEWKCVV
jgi:hypothetical protein